MLMGPPAQSAGTTSGNMPVGVPLSPNVIVAFVPFATIDAPDEERTVHPLAAYPPLPVLFDAVAYQL
jgi:hypothetical protein